MLIPGPGGDLSEGPRPAEGGGGGGGRKGGEGSGCPGLCARPFSSTSGPRKTARRKQQQQKQQQQQQQHPSSTESLQLLHLHSGAGRSSHDVENSASSALSRPYLLREMVPLRRWELSFNWLIFIWHTLKSFRKRGSLLNDSPQQVTLCTCCSSKHAGYCALKLCWNCVKILLFC